MKLSKRHKIFISIVNVISKTWRIKFEGVTPEQKGIVAFWHGNMLPVWKYFSKHLPTAVVSQSKDGEILSTILEKWNFKLVRGSSHRGGKEVLEEISNKAKTNLILITPDGPTGPYHIFKPGAVIAAKNSKSNLYLCQVNVKSKLSFKNSWDRFEFPLPWSKIILRIKEAITVDNELEREEIDKIIDYCNKELND